MDFFDWYFKQVVTQGQMDWAFARVQDGIDRTAADPGLVGILDGLTAAEHSPGADLTVDVAAGTAYDPDGQRIQAADPITVVDCSVDEYGVATDPPTVGWQRYLSVFVAFDRELTEPAVDGNGITVYTHHLESLRFFVRQGAEAAPGGAVRPPLLADALLVADVLLTHGQTAILNAHLDDTRRQDWLRAWADPGLGFVSEWLIHGQPAAAIEDVWRRWNEHVSDLAWPHSGGAVAYTPGQTWFGAQPLSGPTPPVVTVAQALDAILFDLGAAGPPAGDALISATDYTGTFVAWAAQSIAGALAAAAGALDTHIGGAAPFHPASAITFTPYSWIASGQLQAVIQEIVDDLGASGPLPVMDGASLVGFDPTTWAAAGFPSGGITTLRVALNALVPRLMSQLAGISGSQYLGVEPIAGSPESFAGGFLFAALTAVYGHLNARTERATRETVSAGWVYDNGGATPVNRTRQFNNAQFENVPFAKTALGGAAPPFAGLDAVAAGFYHAAGAGGAQPWTGANGVDLGAGVNVCDLCMFQNQTTKVRQVAFLIDKGGPGTYPANAVNSLWWMDQYNPTGGAALNLDTVPNGLPAPVVRWRPMACCSDGQYVYVLFEDYNGGASTHRVQAYDVIAGTKHPGWPNGGLLLTGTGQSTSRVSQRIKVVDMAAYGSANRLAVLNSWVSGTVAGTSQCVSIIDATNGTLVGQGCGDMPVSGVQTIRAQEAIASDGTYVYFGYHNWTTGAGGIATLTIAAPATGKPTGTWPRAPMPNYCPVDLLFDGVQLWASGNDSPSLPIAASMVHVFDFGADTMIQQLLDAVSSWLAVGHLAFDGLNVWVQAMRDMDGAGGFDLEAMFALPVCQARATVLWTAPDAETRARVAYLQPGAEAASITMDTMGRCMFDGDGVWAVLQSQALGSGMEGKLRCVSLAHKR